MVLLFFALDDREQFYSLDGFLQEIRLHASPDAHIILVGNKSDLERVILNEEIQQFVEQNKLYQYVEVSAKTGKNVQYLFEMIA